MRPFVFALLVLAACWKPFAPSRPSQVAFEPRVHSFRLGNGLSAVVIPDPTAVEVQVTMHYAVDSVAGRIDVAAVRRLRRSQLEPALRGVTLGTAAILLRGPRDPIREAYRALGREPTAVK
jgi:hypothetical protein